MTASRAYYRRLILRLLSLPLAGAVVPVSNAATSAASLDSTSGAADGARFMRLALDLKRLAVERGDQAYGAVIVRADLVVGRGPSRVVVDGDPTAHAEMEAILKYSGDSVIVIHLIFYERLASRGNHFQVFTGGDGQDAVRGFTAVGVDLFQLLSQCLSRFFIDTLKSLFDRPKMCAEKLNQLGGGKPVMPLRIHLASESDIREVFAQPLFHNVLIAP